jgi:phytoene dehydrogenase-like protein
MSRLHDTIIIGTGLGGLTAGLALQRAGHSVLLLEAGKAFGGMTNPFARKGYEFDVGYHYVGEAGPGQYLRRVLDSLGLEELEFREINPECFDRYVFDGYETRVMKGLERWCESLARDFPRERKNIWRFARLLEDTDRLVHLALGKRSLRDVLPLLRAPFELARLFRVPYGDVLDRYFRDPMLKAVFGAGTGVLGIAPGRASAILAMVGMMHYLKGSYYPVGGGGRVRDAYVNALKARGAELLRNRHVSRIRKLEDGSFLLSTRSNEEFRARTVISNADARQTLQWVEGATPNERTRRIADKARPSLSALGVYVATELDLARAGLTDANVWHYGSPDLDATYAAITQGRAPERPFFFMSSSTLKDPGSRTDGRHTLEVMTWVPAERYTPWFDAPTRRRGADYEGLKEEGAQQLLEAAERFVPGLRDHLILRDCATPATVWSYVRTPQGGVFGPENTPEWSPARRYAPTTGIPGLYLAGASVSGPGIFACTLSGMVAARACGSFLRPEQSRRRRQRLIPAAPAEARLSSAVPSP